MKTLYALPLAAILTTAAMPVFAEPVYLEMRDPGQPFIHPLDDQSYRQNVSDDRMAVSDPYDYENGVVPMASSRVGESQSAANAGGDAYDNENAAAPSDNSRYDRQAASDSSGRDPYEYENTAQPSDNGHVKYISGGVADSGMQAMDAKENGYNLKTLFVRDPNGEYLANVGVTITDRNGTLLQTSTKGPVLLASVPPGVYNVTARTESGDQTLTQRVKIGRDHLSSYTFRFQAMEASEE